MAVIRTTTSRVPLCDNRWFGSVEAIYEKFQKLKKERGKKKQIPESTHRYGDNDTAI